MRTPIHRTTAWLCLVFALFTALAPARGFTLCVLPGGGLRLDLTASGTACVCCSEEPPSESTGAVARSESRDDCCACKDAPVPGVSKDPRSVPKPIDLALAARIAEECRFVVVAELAWPRVEFDAWVAPPPRPPPAIPLIRSVVLLV